jgi:hypothetical protein
MATILILPPTKSQFLSPLFRRKSQDIMMAVVVVVVILIFVQNFNIACFLNNFECINTKLRDNDVVVRQGAKF